VVKISAQSEHFSVLVHKVSHSDFGFLNLFLDIWIQNPDPDSECGSGSRLKLNADPTRSGSETLVVQDNVLTTHTCACTVLLFCLIL
jgi:hypothetical protein